MPPYLASPVQADVVPTLGAALLGPLIANVMLGVNYLMTLRYFLDFPRDPDWMKSLVGILAVLDLAHTIGISSVAWWWMVQNWGNVATLPIINWGWHLEVASMGVIVLFVQFFFAWRVYVVSNAAVQVRRRRNLIIPAIIAFLAVFQEGWCTSAVIFNARVKSLEKFGEYSWGVYMWFFSGALGDLIITVSMFAFINVAKTRTHGAGTHTHSVLNRFLKLTIETNVVTLVGAIIVPVLYATTVTKSLAFDAIAHTHTKFYILSTHLVLATRSDARQNQTSQSSSNSIALRSNAIGQPNTPGVESYQYAHYPSSPRSPTVPAQYRSPQVSHIHVSRTVMSTEDKMTGDMEKNGGDGFLIDRY